MYCISVPENTIAAWEASTYAASYPGIVWGEDCAAYDNVPLNEMQVLIDMFNNLAGDNWTNNTNWDGDLDLTIESPVYNASIWHGVTTDTINGGKHITSIMLPYRNLVGTLPDNLGNLTKLRSFAINHNTISGVVPSSFASCTDLETASLHHNKLEGDVPDLTDLANLNSLQLSQNKFQFGSFETEFNAYKNDIVTFNYSPQAIIGRDTTVQISNDGITLTAGVTGENNSYQWYKNYSLINGATDSNYVINDASIETNGDYYCRVTNTTVTSLTINTAITELVYSEILTSVVGLNGDYLKIYPNPADHFVTIEMKEESSQGVIILYNLTGAVVMSNKIKGKLSQLQLNEIPSGVYSYKLITSETSAVGKLVKR